MSEPNSGARAGPSGHDFPSLDVSVRRERPATWVVDVRGELDLATGALLKKHLESYDTLSGNDGHPQRIVYLLSDLAFMDASGLHALLNAVDGHGSDTITVREPSPLVRRLLELVDLDSLIEEGTRG